MEEYKSKKSMEAKGLRKTNETKKEPKEDKAQTIESG